MGGEGEGGGGRRWRREERKVKEKKGWKEKVGWKEKEEWKQKEKTGEEGEGEQGMEGVILSNIWQFSFGQVETLLILDSGGKNVSPVKMLSIPKCPKKLLKCLFIYCKYFRRRFRG